MQLSQFAAVTLDLSRVFELMPNRECQFDVAVVRTDRDSMQLPYAPRIHVVGEANDFLLSAFVRHPIDRRSS